MQIEIARLVAGTETPAGDGITGAQRCVVILPDGSRKRAVLKRGPIDQITAEAFSALLLRAWNLPVPEPFLVDENGVISFAGVDDGYPNLKQRLGISPNGAGVSDEVIKNACELILKFPTTTLAIACDEAIDNRDRNLGNILWDGTDEAWIDHAFSLGVGAHMDDFNKLCVLFSGTPEQQQICSGATARSWILEQTAPSDAETALVNTSLSATGLSAFVAGRISNLAMRIIARFPQPADLLSDADNLRGAP